MKRFMPFLSLLLICSTSFASAKAFETPVLDSWHKLLAETGKFPYGCVYPDTRKLGDRGNLSLSVCEDSFTEVGEENIAPMISWGVPGQAFLLQKEYREDKTVNIFGVWKEYAGAPSDWAPIKGVHACIGEENNGDNEWGLSEFTRESLISYASNQAERKCLQAGGEVQDIESNFTTHFRVRKSLAMNGLLPVRRKCLSANVVLKCGFNNRRSDIKKMTEDLKHDFPNNPAQDIFTKFVGDL